MSWNFERVASPFQGPANGVVWDGTAIIFSLQPRLVRMDICETLRCKCKAQLLSRPTTPQAQAVISAMSCKVSAVNRI